MTPVTWEAATSCGPEALAALLDGLTAREAAAGLIGAAEATGRSWRTRDGGLYVSVHDLVSFAEREGWSCDCWISRHRPAVAVARLAATGLSWLATVITPAGGGHVLALGHGRVLAGDSRGIYRRQLVREGFLVTRRAA